MQVSCSTHWAIWLWFSMECCSSFLHFFIFNPLQNTTALTCSDDGFMMLGSLYVDVGSSRRVNGVTDTQTDGRTAFQLYIYIDCRCLFACMVVCIASKYSDLLLPKKLAKSPSWVGLNSGFKNYVKLYWKFLLALYQWKQLFTITPYN